MGPSRRLAAVACAAALLIGGCGADADDASITVFAAASLTDAFGAMGAAFEAANPGTTVTFSFAGSSALREQILSGAPADVFASASTVDMDEVVAVGAAADPITFAENELQIAVPAGNPGGITGLADFADESLLLGLCAQEVPCGRLGREALAKVGVTPSIDTDEPDVRSLLTKVAAGELDAGIVYVTDVRSAGDAVEGVDIPAEENVVATYPIAALVDADDGPGATAFVDFVRSAEGRAILASYGFAAP